MGKVVLGTKDSGTDNEAREAQEAQIEGITAWTGAMFIPSH